MTPLRITIALCLGFITVVVGLFVYSVVRTPILSVEQFRDMGVFILPRPREIAPFRLTAHSGSAFDLDSLTDRWSFLFFGFTNCPDVCPTSLAVMAQAQRQLAAIDPVTAAAFQGVLVSVDPERDDAQRLASYVGAFSESFLGAGGELREVATFAEQLNVAFAKVPVFNTAGGADGSRYQVEHTANIVIVNPAGHYHGFIKYPQQADTIVATFQSLSANF